MSRKNLVASSATISVAGHPKGLTIRDLGTGRE
jgi:hypothetical protein